MGVNCALWPFIWGFMSLSWWGEAELPVDRGDIACSAGRVSICMSMSARVRGLSINIYSLLPRGHLSIVILTFKHDVGVEGWHCTRIFICCWSLKIRLLINTSSSINNKREQHHEFFTKRLCSGATLPRSWSCTSVFYQLKRNLCLFLWM
jgi:hypothetical protein